MTRSSRAFPARRAIGRSLPFSVALVTLFTACQSRAPVRQMPPPDVEVTQAEARDVPIVREWIGTLDGRVNAEIRAQVSGYLLRQDYREGSFVRKGQLLFEIDTRPFEAALSQAKGMLAQAEGNLQQANGILAQSEARLGKAQLDVKRYAPLAKTKAISQEEMDNATQAEIEARANEDAAKATIEAARASIAAAKATVDDAALKLEFTRIVAPVDGIAGLATVQVGNLVSPTSGVLTVVSAVDPIKAYFTVSEQEYLQSHREIESGGTGGAWVNSFQLVLADGSVYPHKGTFFMADREVDVATGTLRLAVLFPNPGNVLRPGQYGRVRAVLGVRKGAVLVPQRAVGDLQGSYQVAVVDGANKVAMRPVRMGERIGTSWIVEEGVRAGERVVVEGLLKIRNGVLVNPRDAGAK